MKDLTPAAVLARVAASVPEDCREQLVVVGSLAAGYQLLGHERSMRTKDVDCVLSPRVQASTAGARLADRLLAEGWRFIEGPGARPAGDADTPDDDLPAVRLSPPDDDTWFLELLTVPAGPADRAKRWLRVQLASGHFGLPSFGFLSLAALDPSETSLGLRVGRVEFMALANLLEHPRVGDQTMSGLIVGRRIKRANKDLGRVLAIARLATDSDLDTWSARWAEALRAEFPDEWRDLGVRVGHGLRELLSSPEDLEQAHHTCVTGLLASTAVTAEQLRLTGQRFLVDVVEPFEDFVRGR